MRAQLEVQGKQQESLTISLDKKAVLIYSHERSIPIPNGAQFESPPNYGMLQISKARYKNSLKHTKSNVHASMTDIDSKYMFLQWRKKKE